jgi:hypothetical protein
MKSGIGIVPFLTDAGTRTRPLPSPDRWVCYRRVRLQALLVPASAPERTTAVPLARIDLIEGKSVPEDDFFNLMTVQPADWSISNGLATYIHGVPTDRFGPNSIEG